MPRRIKLDPAYLARVKKEQLNIAGEVKHLQHKQIPCIYCGGRTIDKFDDLTGHFTAFCPKCGQVGIYDAANYRHYPSCLSGSCNRMSYPVGQLNK